MPTEIFDGTEPDVDPATGDERETTGPTVADLRRLEGPVRIGPPPIAWLEEWIADPLVPEDIRTKSAALLARLRVP